MAKPPLTRTAGESRDSTADLVSKARSGDRSAENEIVRRNLSELRQYARGRLPGAARGRNDTEDLVQETMLRALKQLPTFDASRPGGFRAYLRTSLRHRVCDEVRRAIRFPHAGPIEDAPDSGPTPHDVMARRESVECYRRALGTLRPNYRALTQAYIERGWSYERIAKMFEKPSVNSARVAVGRAVQSLLKAIRAEAAATRRVPRTRRDSSSAPRRRPRVVHAGS
jgi:RNA polymerase sigma factor (sigma-70 family)